MFFDKKGLPRDNGATDMMDSCRLAAMLAIINHTDAPKMEHYLSRDANNFTVGVRHPDEIPANNYKNFTRDQLIPLVAGLYAQNGISSAARKLYDGCVKRGNRAQNTEYDQPGTAKQFPDGADFLHPGHMLVIAKAGGRDGFFNKVVGYPFVFCDVVFNAIFASTREPNQLICCLYILGPWWIRFYKTITPDWKKAVNNYWSGWRDESVLADKIIAWMDKF